MYITNWNVTGHNWAVDHLTRSLEAGRLGHAYLITGPAGIGKTTFARAFAQAICCTHPDERPCGRCRACLLIASNQYADFTTIEADGNTLKIEQVRDLQTTLMLRPLESAFRIVILRRFHEATPQAMDSLLKTLEEPPPYVVIMLTADTADNLLPTIKSRCQPLNLRLLPSGLIRETLERDHWMEPEKASLLAQLSGGRLGWAIRAAGDEELLSHRTTWIGKLEEVLTQSRVGRFILADQMSKDASKDRDAVIGVLELWQTYWRDVLLAHYHTITGIANRDHDHTIRQIAEKVNPDEALKAITAIQRTIKYISKNVNARLALEVLMLDMPRLKLVAAPN